MAYRWSGSYGEMPPREVFLAAFAEEVPDGKYTWNLKGEDATLDVPEGPFDGEELFGVVESLRREWDHGGNENAGDLASCVLETLSLEWI